MFKWLRSNNARRVFLYSSWAVLWMGVFVVFMLTPWFRQIDSLPKGDITLRVLGAVTGVVGSPASIVLWFGMLAFCLSEDTSPVSRKALWFLLFFATASFGSAAYFFKVYKRQVLGATTTADGPDLR
jgi:hypothetical protein